MLGCFSLLLSCVNPVLNQDKEYLIEVSIDSNRNLTAVTSHGRTGRLNIRSDPIIFDFPAVVKLLKSKVQKGYRFGNLHISTRQILEDAMRALSRGVIKLQEDYDASSNCAIPKKHKDQTSAPAAFIKINESELSFSPNW